MSEVKNKPQGETEKKQLEEDNQRLETVVKDKRQFVFHIIMVLLIEDGFSSNS